MAGDSVQRMVDGKVSADLLIRELSYVVENAGGWADNCRLAEDSTWCLWPGQSDDGLKHAFPGDDEPPFPWENSSDTRIRLVDEKVREHCRIQQLASKRGNWSWTGEDGNDYQVARRNAQLLRWQEAKHIPGGRRARNLWIYWTALYGYSVMGPKWNRREELALRRVTLEDVVESFMERFGVRDEAGNLVETEESVRYLETLRSILNDPEESLEWLEGWLGEFFPDAKRKRLKQGAKDLRDEGETDMPQLRVVANHPDWDVLKPLEDVFHPLDVEVLSKSPWIARRRWISEIDLEEMRDEWGDKFVDELLKHEGKSSTFGLENYVSSERSGRRRWAGGDRSHYAGEYDRRGQYEVFYFYHRSLDGDDVPALYRTVLSPFACDDDGPMIAEQEIYDDGSGDMPFIEYTLWDDRRALLECRGIPYLLFTYQQEKKSLRDARKNVTDLSVLPPLRRAARDKNTPLILGPDMPVYESVPNSTNWMEPPQNRTSMARDIEDAIDREANRLAGAYDAEVPDAVVQINQEATVDQFTAAYSRLLARTFQLDQMFLDEVTVMRVAGVIDQPFKVSREEIQGQFDVTVTFDPKELDLKFAMEKWKAASEVVQADVAGVTDRAGLIKLGLQIVDPVWADMLVQDERVADEREIRETRNAINDIVNGQEAQMSEGINAAIRLQYLSQEMKRNPILIQIEQNPEDPRNQALMQYVQFLQFQYHQQVVAPKEGRLGVKLGA